MNITLSQLQTQPQDTLINTRFYHYPVLKMLFKFSFFPRTIPIWNSLPEELVNCNSITTFRTKLDHIYHSTNEKHNYLVFSLYVAIYILYIYIYIYVYIYIYIYIYIYVHVCINKFQSHK